MSIVGTTDTTARTLALCKDVYVRGDEIQVLFEDGVAYRTPDFGTTWYEMGGLSVDSASIAFNVNKDQSVVADADSLQYVGTISGEYLSFVSGAAIDGKANIIVVDIHNPVAYVATSSKLYRTTDWGETASALKTGGLQGVALGPEYVKVFSAPDIASYEFNVIGDSIVSYDDWTPTPSQSEGSYWINLTADDSANISTSLSGGVYASGIFLPYVLVSGSAWYTTFSERGISEVRVVSLLSGNGVLRLTANVNSTTYRTSDYTVTSEQEFAGAMTINPNTGVGWLPDDLIYNLDSFGVETYKTSSNMVVDRVYAQVYIEGDNTKMVGATPLVRSTTVNISDTTISLSHPSTVAGILREVQLNLPEQCNTIEIGTFTTSGGNYTNRDSQTLGTVAAGYTSTPVDIEIEVGDYIGVYGSGTLYADLAFENGIATATGDKIPCSNQAFTPTAKVVSLRGVIYD